MKTKSFRLNNHLILPAISIKIILFGFLLLSQKIVKAQLSDLHYLPPLKQVGSNNLAEQVIFITTPEEVAFDVHIFQGESNTPTVVSVSKNSPFRYDLESGNNNITLLENVNTGIVLRNGGLRFESPGGQKFYVNYRAGSAFQGASLTSKGRAALGTSFKWGGIPIINDQSEGYNATIGIMATEDNTIVTISDYDPNCEFRLGEDISGIKNDKIVLNLFAGQSFVLEAVSTNPANLDGWIGGSIESDKNIAISNGNILVGVDPTILRQDAGIEQPIPIDKLGKEHIFIRGNGSDAIEFPIIIAAFNNTEVFVNGSDVPFVRLNEGDYATLPAINYSGDSVGHNMFVTSSKGVYAYQCTGGSVDSSGLALNFTPPLNCLLPNELDNIASIGSLPSQATDGGLTILASTDTPDNEIIVTDATGAVPLPTSFPVAGTAQWKTFFIPGLSGNTSIGSTGTIAVGFLGSNNSIGVASYFSGFDTIPLVDYSFTGDGTLGSTYTVTDTYYTYDSYQWYENGILVPGATSASYTPTTAGDIYVTVGSGGCIFDSSTIPILYSGSEIVLIKEGSQIQVKEGDTVTFTITVQSLGQEDLTNLNIEEALPQGLSVIDALASKGSWLEPNWTIGDMTPGEIQSIFITVRVDGLPEGAATNVITNIVFNTQDQADGNRAEDSPEASVEVEEEIIIDPEPESEALIIDNDAVGPLIDEGFFRITNIENYPNNNFQVYNRWGGLVFENQGYTNGNNDFRGISNRSGAVNQDDELPVGVYYYKLDYNDSGEQKMKSGYLYITR